MHIIIKFLDPCKFYLDVVQLLRGDPVQCRVPLAAAGGAAAVAAGAHEAGGGGRAAAAAPLVAGGGRRLGGGRLPPWLEVPGV